MSHVRGCGTCAVAMHCVGREQSAAAVHVAWFLLQAACGCLLYEPSDEAVLLSEKTTARSTALDSGETGREPCALFAATGLQLRNGCTAASSCTYV